MKFRGISPKEVPPHHPAVVGLFVLLGLIVIFCLFGIWVFRTVVAKKIAYNSQYQDANTQILGMDSEKKGVPVGITIPSIKVDTTVEQVGVTKEGEMGLPSSPSTVGWFGLGPRPGQKGSSVIAGHVDDEVGNGAVFANLSELVVGDQIFIETDQGHSLTFIVQESQTYNAGFAEAVFGRNDGIYLNLITCDGVWDAAKNSYSKRLVVFAKLSE